MTVGRRERLLVLAFLGLYVFLALWAASGDASVADEHPQILSGWLFWHSGRFSRGLDNPRKAAGAAAVPWS